MFDVIPNWVLTSFSSPFLKPTTDLKIEILDVEGNPLFLEPGRQIRIPYRVSDVLVAIQDINNK